MNKFIIAILALVVCASMAFKVNLSTGAQMTTGFKVGTNPKCEEKCNKMKTGCYNNCNKQCETADECQVDDCKKDCHKKCDNEWQKCKDKKPKCETCPSPFIGITHP
jgi:hypothetical protein